VWGFLVGLLLCTSCAGSGSFRSPFRSSSGQDEVASAAAEEAVPLEERVAHLEQSLERLEALVRGMNAELAAQLDEIQSQLNTLDVKATAQDRLLRTMSPGRRSAAEGVPGSLAELPRPGRAVAYLDGNAPDRMDSPAGAASSPPMMGPGAVRLPDSGDDLRTGDMPLLPVSERAQAQTAAGAGSTRVAGGDAASSVPDSAGGPSGREEPGDLGSLIPAPPEEGRRLYDIAYRDLMQENFQLALINFRAFLDRYPGTRLSDNAQYWIGEVYYAQGQFNLAVEEFRKVVEEYPGQDKVPAACYKLALCFEQLDDRATAQRYFEYLRERFPRTREAQMAMRRLEEQEGP
jgi:tol-pal system protein YbgF